VSEQASPQPLLLLVDDDALIVESLSFALADEFEMIDADSRASARNRMLSL